MPGCGSFCAWDRAHLLATRAAGRIASRARESLKIHAHALGSLSGSERRTRSLRRRSGSTCRAPGARWGGRRRSRGLGGRGSARATEIGTLLIRCVRPAPVPPFGVCWGLRVSPAVTLRSSAWPRPPRTTAIPIPPPPPPSATNSRGKNTPTRVTGVKLGRTEASVRSPAHHEGGGTQAGEPAPLHPQDKVGSAAPCSGDRRLACAESAPVAQRDRASAS